jgi:hypothetical protein
VSYIFTDAWAGYHGFDQDYVHNEQNRKPLESSETRPQGNIRQRRAFHLFRYLDEQAYRFNERKANDGERFIGVASSVLGRRLTLCGADREDRIDG